MEQQLVLNKWKANKKFCYFIGETTQRQRRERDVPCTKKKVHFKDIWQTYHRNFYQRKNTSDHHDRYIIIWHSYHRHFYQRKNNHRQYNEISTEILHYKHRQRNCIITGRNHRRQFYQRENYNQQSFLELYICFACIIVFITPSDEERITLGVET